MPKINMLSSACKVKGQGVASAYIEQVNLVKAGLGDKYKVLINKSELTDIMHYHTIDLKHYLSIPFAKLKGATVGYVHFLPETLEGSLNLPKFIKKILYRYILSFYRNMDYLVTVNPDFIKKLVSLGISKEKIFYIPNFVSNKEFFLMDENKKNLIKKKYGIPKEKFVVLGVGQIQKRKGILDFIKLAEKMKDIVFIWAGGFSFGNITDGYKELNNYVKNPPKNIIFTGIVSREYMNEIYNLADVFFMPSYNELFPMSILEAINVELPILVRDLKLYDDILFDYCLRGKDNIEFEKIIYRLKDDNEFYYNAVQKSIRCNKFYSKENVLDMWRKFYNMVYEGIGRYEHEKKHI